VRGTTAYLDTHYLRSGVPSTKSDVYSFGVVLLEIITGQPPLQNSSHILDRVVLRVQAEGYTSVLAKEVLPELEGHHGAQEQEGNLRPQEQREALPADEGTGGTGHLRPQEEGEALPAR